MKKSAIGWAILPHIPMWLISAILTAVAIENLIKNRYIAESWALLAMAVWPIIISIWMLRWESE